MWLAFAMEDMTCVCNERCDLHLQWNIWFAFVIEDVKLPFAMKDGKRTSATKDVICVCNERCDLHLLLTTWFAFELEEIRPAFAMKDVKLAFAGKVWDFHNFR